MISAFQDWTTKSITLKKATTTVDAAGVPVHAEETVASGLRVNYWTDVSRETNVNDKFVDQATGSVLLPPKIAVDTTMWFEIGGVKHYVVGVDNVAGMGEFTHVSWRRENG